MQTSMYYLLILWIIIYISSALVAFLKLREIIGLIKLLNKYLDSATIKYEAYHPCLIKQPTYEERLSEVLFKYPVMSQYIGLPCDILKYGASDIENYNTAINIYNRMLMKRNYLINDFFHVLNPFLALKTLFSLPSLFLSWIGFSIKDTATRAFNVFVWAAGCLIELYSDEIKTIITSLFQYLTHA